MTHPISFKRSALWGAAALALCCTLASCGGDDDDNGGSGSGGGGGGGSAGDAAVTLDATRLIAPLDTKSAPQPKARAAARAALGADAPVAEISLPALDVAKALPAAQKGQAMPIGVARTLEGRAGAGEVAQLLQWQPLAGGGQAAALRFVAPGAGGVRLAVDVQQLPAGALLRFYGAAGEVQEVPAAEAARLRAVAEAAGLTGEAARLVWSLPFDGEQATLEVELPAGAAPGDVALAVPRLTQLALGVRGTLEKSLDDVGESGSCNLNATCVIEDIDMESRAVAKMVYDDGVYMYLCTGTLLNDAAASRTPYFISANHCISTQTEASSLVTYWFFRAASCGNAESVSSDMRTLGGGAALLTTSSTYDTTLLRLNRQPPTGAVYAGSYFGALDNGSGVLGVHNPSGDLQKYSVGAISGYASCGGDSCSLSASQSAWPMFRIGWSRGTTEQGSSGSGLFVRDAASGTRYFAGVLHGGNASCSNRGGYDVYGRFNLAFGNTGLQNWLAP